MVDKLTAGDSNPIRDGNLLQLRTQNVSDVNRQAAADSSGVSSLSELDVQDGVNISSEALNKLESEKEVLKFSRLAQRVQETSDQDKVSRLKDLVNSGRINEYLRDINTNDLAQKILDSPFGNYLR